MQESTKKLVLYEINLCNICYVFFLRFFFREIFYIRCSFLLRNLETIKILKKFKINWINYPDYNISAKYCSKLKKNNYFSDYISKILSDKIWDEDIKNIYIKQEYLESCLAYKIQQKCDRIFELFENSKILSAGNNNIYILANKTFFFKKIYIKYYSDCLFKILPHINFFYHLKYFLYLLIFIVKILISKFFLFLNLNKFFFLSSSKILNKNIKNKVIYFPHKGMFYLDNLKDQFYSSNKNSFLNKKKIIHIEWQSDDIDKKSFIFYNKNKIPLEIWKFLSFRKMAIISKAFVVLKKITLIRKLFHYDILLIFFHSFFQILKAQEKLLNFKEARLALIGYDFLFPLEISVALKKAGIKTVCVQERMIMSGISHKMIFDDYFIPGPQSYQMIKKKMNKTIGNFHKYYLQKTNLVNLKKYKLKKNNLNCLAIDFHSEEDWYSNGTALNNWCDNNDFYENIIELAKKNNKINFHIKSKNYNWMKNIFFAKTIQKIKNIKNINILNNDKKWTPENCLAYADFGIARHSSMSDQMLYLNKPVLIYDLNGFPSKLFPFDKNIICKNKKDLKKKFISLIMDIRTYNHKLNKARKLLFYYNSIVNLNIFLEKTLK
jgi:hypothetical protein